MLLHKHFKLIGIKPGVVIHARLGSIDFSKPVPHDTLEKLYFDDFPYIRLTEDGCSYYEPKPQDPSPKFQDPSPKPQDKQPVAELVEAVEAVEVPVAEPVETKSLQPLQPLESLPPPPRTRRTRKPKPENPV